MPDAAKLHSQPLFALGWGGLIGLLGGLIGLGGAEFRLPVLVGFFRYPVLRAIMVNLMVSLVTVTFSLGFRGGLATPAVIWNGGRGAPLVRSSLNRLSARNAPEQRQHLTAAFRAIYGW